MSALWKDYSGSIAAGGTAQSLLLGCRERRALVICNISNDFLYIAIKGDAVVAGDNSLPLAPNNTLSWTAEEAPANDISIIGATTGQKFVCWADK